MVLCFGGQAGGQQMGMWTEGFGEAIMGKELSASDHQSSSVSYEMDGPVCKAMSKTIF